MRSPRVSLSGESPLLTGRSPEFRSKVIVGFLAVGFLCVAGRAAYVQVLGNDFFKRQGELRYARTLVLPASRGRILDRNGHVLAVSVPAPSLWVNPEEVEREQDKLKDLSKWRELARTLNLSEAELMRRLDRDDKSFVWLRRQLEPAQAEKVQNLKLKGVYSLTEYKRLYPEGEALAHIVGFTNVEDKGQGGIELVYEKQLAGKAGSRRVIKDRMGRIVENVGEIQPPIAGEDIKLSVDSKIQYITYERLRETVQHHKAKAGSVVVLDAESNEVLALVNYPSFNPAERKQLSGEQQRNRALIDIFEPGSTMKPVAVSLALDKGLVQPETPIATAPGSMQLGGFTIKDSHPKGTLSVKEVIQYSSNVGTVKMAMRLSPHQLWDGYTQFGLGQKPNIRFPLVASGRLRPYKDWQPIEQATMSYGYGLSVSLLQLAQVYSVFARDGRMVPAALIKGVNGPQEGRQVISARTASAMRDMLYQVTQRGGTGQKAQTNGYTVGGKTGTAHKQEGKGYASNKYRGVFAGLSPVDRPRIVVAVMIDEPRNGQYYGGDVAAPLFSEVVQQTMRIQGVPPDLNVRPEIVVHDAAEEF